MIDIFQRNIIGKVFEGFTPLSNNLFKVVILRYCCKIWIIYYDVLADDVC